MVNITDIGAASPNVNLSSSAPIGGSSAAPSVFIRGIGQQDFNNTADPGVGIYVDGIFVSRGVGGLLDTVDLKRIEILRGPQGTLFGRNSIAVAINLISKKPDNIFAGKIGVTAGDSSLGSIKGSVNIPLTDNLWSRFSLLRTKQDGYVDAVQYDNFQLGEKIHSRCVGRYDLHQLMCLRWILQLTILIQRSHPRRYSDATPMSTDQVWRAKSGGTFSSRSLSDFSAEIAAGREFKLETTRLPLLMAPYAALGAKLQKVAIELCWSGAVLTMTPDGGLSVKGDMPAVSAWNLDAVTCRLAELPSTVLPRETGRVVDPETWEQLNGFAYRAFAPPTESSRMGAGAGLVDND